jgi:hypothetical protein
MKDNPIDESLRSDHLFLLVGTNPLPNWVAAKLLLNPGGRVYLIYTDAVKDEAAKRLRRVLRQDGINVSEEDDILTREADADDILDVLQKPLEKLKGQSVGLNYTGGTKMMSVHAHRTFSDFSNSSKKPGTQVSFSYLDAGSLKMKFDYKGEYSVSTAVEITPETLLKLHGDFETGKMPYEKDVKGQSAATALSLINSHRAGVETWRKTWLNLKEILPEREDFLNRLETIKADLPDKQQPDSRTQDKIIAGYEALLSALHSKPGDSLEVIAMLNGFDTKEKLVNWLKGNWLEHHTLSQIRQVAVAAKLNSEGTILNLVARNDEDRLTESDVLALRGYQLFYFSCFAGNDRKVAKLKLLEAVVRAAQLGGDEARIALVSCVEQSKVTALGNEVEKEWENKVRVKVFGNEDLETLAPKLKRWFDQADSK